MPNNLPPADGKLYPPAHLDKDGRCCGRKPIEYKGKNSTAEGPQRFCDRCCRAYHRVENEQIENWAWMRVQGQWKRRPS